MFSDFMTKEEFYCEDARAYNHNQLQEKLNIDGKYRVHL